MFSLQLVTLNALTVALQPVIIHSLVGVRQVTECKWHQAEMQMHI